MITLAGVHAKGSGRPRAILAGASIEWAAGRLAVLGTPADGTSLLLSCLAGHTRVKRGAIAIDGLACVPGRPDVAWVPLAPVLPESLDVRELLTLAGRLRGVEPSLAALGLESLAPRRVRSLSAAEARGVALTIAVGTKVRTLLVEEPFAAIAGASRVADAIASVPTVIATTASVRDAVELGGSIVLLSRGRIVPVQEAHRPELRVVSRSADALAAAIGQAEGIAAMRRLDDRTLVIAGPDRVRLASVVNRAACDAHIPIELLEPTVASLDEIRARHVA